MRHKAHPFLQTSQSNKKGEASTTSPFLVSIIKLFFCITFDSLSAVWTYRNNLDRSFQLFFQE